MTIANTSTIVAIIPARGGSKGVPGKNTAQVAGQPLLSWTIAAVADAATSIRLVVSTDDSVIAELASDLGAEVVWRPKALAADTTATEPVLMHALDQLRIHDQATLLLLQATSPVRLPGTLDRALAQFQQEQPTALVGVVTQSPFLWMGPPEAPRALYDIDARKRRQDFTTSDLAFRETGSLYVTSVSSFRHSHNRLSGRVQLFVMADVEGIDIDTSEHLAAAEAALLTTLEQKVHPG